MQWGGVKNGALLAIVEREAFRIFLTGDKNMSDQHTLEDRPFAVLVLSAINWPVIERMHVETIKLAIEMAQAGSVRTIECGEFVRRARRMQP
jgi:hypothetical protein